MTGPPEQQPPSDEEALLRALRSPGSASELGEQERYAAMFRGAQGGDPAAPVPLAPRRRRAAGRFGAGSAFVVVLAVGGSAAAAYTNHLPEPVQRFAHHALGPVAPPAPEERQDRAEDRATSAPSTSTATRSPSPTPGPTPSAPTTPSAGPTHRPSHPPSPTSAPTSSASPTSPTASTSPSVTATPTPAPTGSATPSAAPTVAPSPTPAPTPTATPVPPRVPAALSIAGSTHKVDPGQPVAFGGVVTAEDGTPVRKARVVLQTLSGGRWLAVTSARADASGAVSLVLPPISATTAVRLRTVGVHSPRWKVTLHPTLSVTAAPGPDPGTVVLTATAVGAQPGDTVLLLTKAGQLSGTLVGDTVTFTLSPSAKRTACVVALPGTAAHGPGKARITVVAPPGGSGGHG